MPCRLLFDTRFCIGAETTTDVALAFETAVIEMGGTGAGPCGGAGINAAPAAVGEAGATVVGGGGAGPGGGCSVLVLPVADTTSSLVLIRFLVRPGESWRMIVGEMLVLGAGEVVKLLPPLPPLPALPALLAAAAAVMLLLLGEVVKLEPLSGEVPASLERGRVRLPPREPSARLPPSSPRFLLCMA